MQGFAATGIVGTGRGRECGATVALLGWNATRRGRGRGQGAGPSTARPTVDHTAAARYGDDVATMEQGAGADAAPPVAWAAWRSYGPNVLAPFFGVSSLSAAFLDVIPEEQAALAALFAIVAALTPLLSVRKKHFE